MSQSPWVSSNSSRPSTLFHQSLQTFNASKPCPAGQSAVGAKAMHHPDSQQFVEQRQDTRGRAEDPEQQADQHPEETDDQGWQHDHQQSQDGWTEEEPQESSR